MIGFRLTRPQQLTSQELALWDHIQRSSRDFESPYFRPEFTQAVASVRDDVEVLVIEDQGQPAGFFPFQRCPLNLGKPVSGRLSDFHGVIIPRGFRVDARQLLQAARLASWDFDHFVGDQPSFDVFTTSVEPASYIDMSRGYQAYCEERKQAGTEVIRKTQSRERKFEREVGQLHFEFDSREPRVLSTLIDWKVAQFQRTGFMNLFSFPWTQQLLNTLLTGNQNLTGVLSVLWFGMDPIAIAYSLRSFNTAHSWFIAYNQEYSVYSPGMIMMLKFAEHGAEAGIRRVHLGAGDQRFKQSLSNGSIPVSVGSVEAPTLSTLARDAWRWTRSAAASTPWLSFCKAPVALLRPVRSWVAFR
jgi:CelD/BcsL family acetyltransferase involved in cellulose biosynthesis